jgi:hypothetical protein
MNFVCGGFFCPAADGKPAMHFIWATFRRAMFAG